MLSLVSRGRCGKSATGLVGLGGLGGWVMGTALACAPLVAQAGLVIGYMADRNGQPVQDAVFFATPLDGNLNSGAASAEPVVMTQENYKFDPYVSVLRKGTAVRFANKDGRDHHIKSFSLTKAFEMRVPGKADAAQTVVFDKAGDVIMVCHFHDFMRGFIYVVDTPFYGKTDKFGNVALNQLPAGKYQVQAWVPNMLSAPFSQVVQVNEAGNTSVRFQLDFVPKPPPIGRTPSKPAISAPNTAPNYSPF